jgi:methionine synthase / methylenetetrahydrofolate reductase(NADPH)
LRVQGDLLAAHALDVRTLFVTMGDLASIGDYPQAFDHHDIVPTGLVKLVKQQFNEGLDGAGTSIGAPCSFFVGVAVNLTPSDFVAEAKLLRRKIEFGADYALTQPVFDPPRAAQFLAFYRDAYGPLTLPILCGLLPLASVRHAIFLKNEVPGMSVPDALVGRMAGAVDEGRQEGRVIAAELLEEVRPLVQGVYFIPSFRRFDVVAELISSITTSNVS